MYKFIFILILTSQFQTVNAINYRNGSLSYLNGDDYNVNPKSQQTITFEYVAAWDYVDFFMFIDSIDYKNAGSSYYSEFSPRFKLLNLDNSFVSKMYFATTFERGKGGLASDLYGIGFDFKVDGFRYLSANIYQRDNDDISGKGYQLTTAWGYSTKLAEIPLLLDGYIDWTFSSDETEENFHFNPQIKIDMKQWLNTNQQWYLGVEYDYWKNKFGIKNTSGFDTNQNTYSFLVKWHF